MEKLKKYLSNQNKLSYVEQFLSLINKPGHGKGKLHSIDIKTTIYHQEYSGANNYHHCKEFDDIFSKVVFDNFDKLKNQVIEILEKDIENSKKDAEKEYKELFES